MHVERLENYVPTIHNLTGQIARRAHDRHSCQMMAQQCIGDLDITGSNLESVTFVTSDTA